MGDKKVVLKLDLNDAKEKKKALKTVTGLIGIDFVCLDMKDKKMTVVGMIDPVRVVGRLRKFWRTDVVSVGPAKEPEPPKKEEKKEEPKKEEPKKEEAKEKEEPKKEEKPKEEPKKEEKEEKKKDPNEQVAELVKMYRAYNPQMTVQYVVHSSEEDPTSCVIC